MRASGNKISKEEVYKFSEEVEKFLNMLNGITIYSRYKHEINDIEMQKNKIENLVLKFKPTIYEEYSMQTKRAYEEMIYAKKELERVIKEKCYESTIELQREMYMKKAREYERIKEFRNKLKVTLQNNKE
ncbi:hypothetical protein [Clostridium baratii]|uniref:hypothetical protein n=1 Tax=Clostridium baratii TaxID=1561 RepID=UPI0030CEA7F9